MNAVRHRLIQKRHALLSRIAELKASVAEREAMLADVDELLTFVEDAPEPIRSVAAPESAKPDPEPAVSQAGKPSRRGASRSGGKRGKPANRANAPQPVRREPFQGLSVAKAVERALEGIAGEFRAEDIVQAVYEPDPDADFRKTRQYVVNEITERSRRGMLVRVARGLYRRSEQP